LVGAVTGSNERPTSAARIEEVPIDRVIAMRVKFVPATFLNLGELIMQSLFLRVVQPAAIGTGALAILAGFGLMAPAKATTLCPNQATVGGLGETSTNVSGPLDGTCGANSAVKIDIADSQNEGKLAFQSTMPGFPAGLTLGGLGGASADVVFTSQGADQPYFLLPFVDSSDSLGQASATDQILLIEFQPNALSGNTLALDPNTTLFNLYDNTTNAYLQGGQSDTKTLDAWLAEFAVLDGDQLQGIWIAEGLTGSNTGADSLTVNSLTTTPLPATLPLFASGLGVIGLLARRRKRKLTAIAA
jgi:hypothetical protein